ncbi:sugar transferase [Streptomyces chilikensis]|uniref:sugar transferase n=1 Tax=Streptomyces chilikensis TaxID=1194079 RepID=UPI00140C610D
MVGDARTSVGIRETGRSRTRRTLRGETVLPRVIGLRDKPGWYAPALIGVDAVVPAVSVPWALTQTGQPAAGPVTVTSVLTWLAVRGARRRYLREEVGESRGAVPVLHDWLIALAVLAVIGVGVRTVVDPFVVLAALAPALLLSLFVRRVVHAHLAGARRAAQAVLRVLVVGEAGALPVVTGRLDSRTDHPYAVVGTVAVGGDAPGAERLDPPADPDPVSGARAGRTLVDSVRRHRADVVLLAPGARLSGPALRHLVWALQDAEIEVALAPGLVEVSGKRLEVGSVAGLTVLKVAPPQGPGGVQQALKGALDRCGAAFGLLVLSPLLALVALAVTLDSRGPVFYRQQRIGRDQELFVMWKFRTMAVDAEARKRELAERNENDGLMFKMRRDPRVTRVGRLLRRTSLDELPQLLNVLLGDMSLVGPRPPLPEEVAGYDATALRRLRVRPGMTGLWQVSGRSDLSWEETVQLDLHYVDNWSFVSDLDVLSRTLRAVVDGRGAY